MCAVCICVKLICCQVNKTLEHGLNIFLDHILVMMYKKTNKKTPPESYKLITTTASKTNEILLSVCGCLEAHLIAGLNDY